MTRLVALEATRHRDLRLDPRPGIARSPTVPLGLSEAAIAIADFPMFFAKDERTGRFGLVALVGLPATGTLYRREDAWISTYVPEAVIAAPFRLAAASATGLSIDVDDGRLGAAGEPLFDDLGEPSPVLVRERERLERLVADLDIADRTVAALAEAEAIRALKLTLRSIDGTAEDLEGLYGVDEGALADLSDGALPGLYRSGAIALATLVAASVTQLERIRQLHGMVGGSPLDAVTAG